MPEAAFLVIEMPGLHLPFTEFTARHPGCTMDLFLEPIRPGTSDVTVQACGLLRNVPADALDGVLEEARQRYDRLRTLERNDAARTWLGTFQIPPTGLTDHRAHSIFQFLQGHGVGVRWIRIEEGVCFLRGELPATADAAELAARCRGFIEGLDLDGEVDVEPMAERDLGLWRELVTLAARHAQ